MTFLFFFFFFFVAATEEFDYEKLVKALKVVSKYEEVANMHITESGLLTGMNIEDIKSAASKMAFKDGCTKFFKSILETLGIQRVGIHIVSCCWCADVLRTAFSKGVFSFSFSFHIFISSKLLHLMLNFIHCFTWRCRCGGHSFTVEWELR